LTAKGDALFQKVFPTHAEFLRPYFETLSTAEVKSMKSTLVRLRKSFENQERPNQENSTPAKAQGRTKT
jgi:hypothetical protein